MNLSLKIPLFLVSITVLLQSCKPEDDITCELAATITQLNDTTLKVEASNGSTPYFYEWSTSSNLTEITVNVSGTYTVSVSDHNSCITTASFDYTAPGTCGPSTITDSDGNIYDVVSIGSQCWTKQNLGVTAGITEVTDTVAWASLTTPAWCYYANNSTNNNAYGKLYNWYAVEGGNLCPDGWHVPTSADWDVLLAYLGGSPEAGGKMKSTSPLWASPNTGADNSSGFSALPAGYRPHGGAFLDLSESAVFWSSTTYTTDPTAAHIITLNTNSAFAAAGWSDKKSGYSCRCVKD